MGMLWWIGQFGIALELIGAALGVWFAFKTKGVWEDVTVVAGQTVFPMPGAHPRDEFVATFRRQTWIFGLIGAGLALQFIGNFAK